MQPLGSAYSNYNQCQVSAYANNFDFSGTNLPKKGISRKI